MPSTSAGSTAPDSAHPGGEELTSFKDGVVNIRYAHLGSRGMPARTMVAATGTCPTDTPFWEAQTLETHDRRLMAPMSMRFAADDSLRLLHSHDEVRQAIWHTVAKEMHKHGWEGSLPGIIIEDAPLDACKRPGRIDVRFHDPVIMCHMIDCMHEIRVERSDGSSWRFPLLCFSNSLPGRIVPLDILRLEVTKQNSQRLLRSLNTMMEGVGSVIGLATSEVNDSVTGMPVDCITARAYLKLSPSSITMPFKTLIKRMPTHFRWHGTPYALLYAGIELHDTVVQSADFPIGEEENDEASEEEEEHSSSDDSPSRSQRRSRQDGRNGESRKRRRRGDE